MINTFFCQQERSCCFFFSYGVKICFWIQQTLGKCFLPPADCGSIFPEKSCWDVWRSGRRLARGQVNMADEAQLHSPICSTFEHWLWLFLENRARSVDQDWPQGLQFSVHLVSLLSALLRWNGVTGTQKAVVDQVGGRPPNTDHDLLMMQFWLWDMFWSFFSVHPLSWSSLVVI